MAYFPFYMDIEGEFCLIVGGGKTALRKAKVLIEYGAYVKVVASEFCSEFDLLDVHLSRRDFKDEDLQNAFFVICATDNVELNGYIYEECVKRSIPVNCVDDPAHCTVIFPSVIKRGDVSIGISTSGGAPAFSKYLRKDIEKKLPSRTEEICECLCSIRDEIKSRVVFEKRAKLYEDIISRLTQSGVKGFREEAEEIIKKYE